MNKLANALLIGAGLSLLIIGITAVATQKSREVSVYSVNLDTVRFVIVQKDHGFTVLKNH